MLVLVSLPSLFTWKRGWNKRNLKTGQIFEIKKDAVEILKYMTADISMIAYKIVSMYICQHFKTFTFISVNLWQKLKNAEFTDILLHREWNLIIELKTSFGTIGLEASYCLQSFFETQRETTESDGTGNSSSQCKISRYFLVVLFCTSKDTSLQPVRISWRVNYSHWY